MPSTSPIDTILPKNNNSNQDNKSVFLESSQDTNNSDESKNVRHPKTVTINLDRNKLKAGSNSGQDPDDKYENTTGESQPLLGRSNFTWSFCEKLWLIIFMIIVAIGVFIGVFLLMWLGYESTRYHLVVKNKWTAIYPAQEMIKLKLPVHNVSLVELDASDTSVCGGKYYYASCVKLIQTQHINQLKQPDILYNFIVDQDGTIYEGRGWENCTCSGDFNNEELTIGVLVNDGSIGRKVPLYLKNFLQTSQDKLNPCFTITLINGTTLNPVVQRIQEVIKDDKC